MPEENKWPCPCCGYLVFDEPPGSYDICPICFWEDDLSHLRFMRTRGANHVSLIEAQQNYAVFGACEQRVKPFVRPPQPDERRDPEWRPVNVEADNIEDPIPGFDYGRSYPKKDDAVLYYWRATYWRRNKP
jgi:hypothetical protein